VGTNLNSYDQAAEALEVCSGAKVSARRIRRAVKRIADERIEERRQAIAHYQELSFAEQQAGSQAVEEPPELAVISMDGGRYQRRDHFGEEASSGQTHWRETKVGCLLSMSSREHPEDPTPEVPDWLLHSEAIRQLAKTGEIPAETEDLPAETEEIPAESSAEAEAENPSWEAAKLLEREVLASSVEAEQFGWQLASRAWQLGYPRARRLAFVADGANVNWEIQRRHFPQAVPILDLMHALSYAWAASRAIKQPAAYERWTRWIWAGEVDRVIAELAEHRARLGPPPPKANENDPRARVDRAWTYYSNHRQRMDYPAYRRAGLPLTSSHIESTIKQINRRVKGSEKFWSRDCGEGVLQLRADYLSSSQPMHQFWRRHQANQTGSNAYRQIT